MKDFNGGYIVASQEAYDLLIKEGYECKGYDFDKDTVFYINGKRFIGRTVNFRDQDKQFYINNGELSWDKPKPLGFNKLKCSSCGNVYDVSKPHNCKPSDEIPCAFNDITYDTSTIEDLDNLPTIGEDDGTTNTASDNNNSINNINSKPNVCKEKPERSERTSKENGRTTQNIEHTAKTVSTTLSIKDNNGKEYVFEKPEFECELLKVGNIVRSQIVIIGSYRNFEEDIITYWNIDGKCHKGLGGYDNEFNLTPIKPKWYKDESNFPALVVLKDSLVYQTMEKCELSASGEFLFNNSYGDINKYRLATKEELNSLYYEGK